MKLHVENLGRIKKADIDIKPLTVFLGKNNTNKTWAASALFGILEGLRWSEHRPPVEFSADASVDAAVARIIGAAPPSGGAGRIDRVSRDEILGSLRAGLIEFRITAGDLDELTGATVSTNAHAELDIEVDRFLRGPIPAIEIVREADEPSRAVIKYRGNDPATRFGVSVALASFHDAIERYVLGFIRNVWYLPAERAVVALEPHAALRDPAQAWAGPVRDFASMMEESRRRRRRKPSLPGFMTHLESILGGSIRDEAYDQPPQFLPKDDPTGQTITLHAAASLIKSLYGLAAFLREATPGDLLIIDEPEMNAHPEAQAKTAELLAMMANAGITVVVTTHSPYFVDHLTSLIEGAQLRDQDGRHKAAETLFLKDADAFISADKVAVWGFEENPADTTEVRVRSLLKDDRLIDWTTFTKVSEHVMDTYGTILEIEHREAGE